MSYHPNQEAERQPRGTKKGKLTDVAPVYHIFSEARLKTNLNKKSGNKFNNGVGYQSQQTKEMINTDNDDCLEDGVCTWVNMDVSKLQSMTIKDLYDIKLKK